MAEQGGLIGYGPLIVFDTRGTVRTRRSRSIKPAQGPAADRAAGQQGICRTTRAQQSTRGICPHSHWEESSRQQVDKDLAPLNCKGSAAARAKDESTIASASRKSFFC